MSRHQTDPLRPLTADERQQLTRLSRSLSAPAAQVERARALLAIADGASYTAAAHQVGRRHTETISAWVSRFNRDGLAAVRPGHGGGARIRYGADAQQRILAEWARTPQRDQDGTATPDGCAQLRSYSQDRSQLGRPRPDHPNQPPRQAQEGCLERRLHVPNHRTPNSCVNPGPRGA